MKCNGDCKKCARSTDGRCPTEGIPWDGFMYFAQTGLKVTWDEPYEFPEEMKDLKEVEELI